MGMFDNQCMITGIKVDEVVCVFLMERPDGTYAPCSLPLLGHRDPHGRVVRIEEHPSVGEFASGLAAAISLGRINLVRPEWVDSVDVSPDVTGLESLSDLFFRGGSATCLGRPLAMTLIERHVWNAVWGQLPPARAPLELSSVLYPTDIAAVLYPATSQKTRELAAAFHALSGWLGARGIAWAPLRDGSQFDEDDIASLLRTAVRRFRGESTILDGLLAYAHSEVDGSLTRSQLLDGW
jgi:hypothetical protein